MAEIHKQLQTDCVAIGRFPLCHLLLMNNTQYPWCLLVPDRENISEIYQLSKEDQLQLAEESGWLGEFMMTEFNGDKLNIAAIGNIVPQLHVHHVVRYKHDALWPDPIWGKVTAAPYSSEDITALKMRYSILEKHGLTVI
jgi:diadenosine tetraphosphate (Ap4A) HIT family hydrolase